MTEKRYPTLLKFCQQHPAVFLSDDKEKITLAVLAEPEGEVLTQLTFACEKKIVTQTVNEAHFSHLLQNHSNIKATRIPPLPPLNDDAPSLTVIEQCHKLLNLAIIQQASDIHIEPQAMETRIRFRIDGVLHRYNEINHNEMNAIQSRFKLLAGADIAENRRPQDGQFVYQYDGKDYSFRLATLPTRFGEKLVLRLLETVSHTITLKNLDMPVEQIALFSSVLSHPQGLIVVTGPTGSGKTATLYAALNFLNTEARNISSVEDPIEVVLSGINQTQINTKAGLDFPVILRALLRQDPDIVMVGEIRDNQTADIAIKAALTGHLVLTTLHTNSTIDTLYRLNQMGIPNYLIASSLQLVIAQRLVRRLCITCRQPASLPLSDLPNNQTMDHWLARGCSACHGGFHGRYPLFEFLPIDLTIQNAIVKQNNSQLLRKVLKEKQHQRLFDFGLEAVAKGVTTYSEILRVLGHNDGTT